MLRKVTMTGVESSCKMSDLIEISDEFPFVEWGVLLSRDRQGTGRYPTLEWLENFISHSPGLHISGHLCGVWVRELIKGNLQKSSDFKNLISVLKHCQRVQINFSPYTSQIQEAFWKELIFISNVLSTSWIFQVKDFNDSVVSKGYTQYISFAPLFDRSGGKGVSPKRWPSAYSPYNTLFGFAGGLGPDNLKFELEKILSFNTKNNVWIDMESKIRTNDLIDIEKVKHCLQIAKEFVL